VNKNPSDVPAVEAPLGQLERALIDEFLRTRGYDPHKLTELPEQEREALLKQASLYASSRLTEVESRSHFVHEMHDIVPRTGKGD
jgi:hypothetical protein